MPNDDQIEEVKQSPVVDCGDNLAEGEEVLGAEDGVSSTPHKTPCAMITGEAGTGKCLGRGTPVLMFNGGVKAVETIEIGERLMGPDSEPRTVLSLAFGKDALYRISPVKGESWVCNVEHILTLAGTNRHNGEIIDISVRECLKRRKSPKFIADWKLVRSDGVEFQSHSTLPLDPYLAGIWLGDGLYKEARFCLNDLDKIPIVEFLQRVAPKYGLEAIIKKDLRSHALNVRLRLGMRGKTGGSPHLLKRLITKTFTNAVGERYIPHYYLTAKREDRLRLLAGLLDTDGSASCGGYSFSSQYLHIATAVIFLSRSLGFAAILGKPQKVKGKLYHRLHISGDLACVPCLVKHKQLKPRQQIKRVTVTGFEIIPWGYGDFFGFSLDGDGRFLLGDFTLTHNTYSTQKRIEEDPLYGVLCATTGIAAVNLGGTTINSLLGFFDTASLIEAFQRGRITSKIHQIAARGYKNIIVDEGSMLVKDQLDIIYRALTEVNAYKSMKKRGPLGLIVIGDVCQLPPIVNKNERKRGEKTNPKWLFKADVWEKAFAPNIVRLTKVWRQSQPQFLQAINHLRRGQGKSAVEVLDTLTKFEWSVNQNFDGTTIMATNQEVDRHNFICLQKIDDKLIQVDSARWGKQSGEWKNIPEQLELKIGAYVMILSNDSPAFSYVNGDTGHIVDYNETLGFFSVELKRTGEIVQIRKIHRTINTYNNPDPAISPEDYPPATWDFIPFGKVSYDEKKEIWHLGGVRYFPLRLAWASSVHKSQGLSLDACQIDFRHPFFDSPAMAYVAISRCRTPEGLRLVGRQDELVKRCCIDPDVIPWL